MRRLVGEAVFLCAITALGACAPALAPAPGVTSPRYADFLYPFTPPGLASGTLAVRQQRGWQFLQAGDLRGARREFQAALQESAAFFPAEAGLAYVSLADQAYADAVTRFDKVLHRSPSYVPALVGRGDACIGSGRTDEAVKSFQAALAADPSLGDVRRRVEVLALRSQQDALKAARQAAETGHYDQAAAAYERAIQASPDSAFLYRELAGVERAEGRLDVALEHLRKAAALDPGDARALVQIGDLLETRGDFAGAAGAYAEANGIDASADVSARLERARARADLARLPEEYRAIVDAAQVTRGDLAALIGVRLAPLLETSTRQDASVVTDVRGSWAAPWILAVVRAGVMEPYPNHAFSPRAVVRRLDLAQVASRLLAIVAARRPELGARWRDARPLVADVPVAHLGYPAVAMVVGAGVMPLFDGANFRPARPVSGREAIDVLARLEVLAR
jgi:tetratricopeptide (TPR) repeat protein